MYATARRYTLVRGGMDRLAPRVEQEFLPMMRAVRGFVSYALVQGEPEGDRDVVLTFSVFQTKEGADESTRRAADWVSRTLAELEPSAPQVTAGEVKVTSMVTAPSYAP